jgi:glycosyltransferase involved in cell wall biosynthesis
MKFLERKTMNKRTAARKQLDIYGNIVLFFGFVREYKGLEYLLRAMPLIIKEIDVKLMIVGEFWNDKKKYMDLISDMSLKDNVHVIDKYVPNEEVSKYFNASNLVVLPYTSATGSGIVQLAFGCGRPVVTTTVGSLREVVDDGKTGYLVEPMNPNAIAQAVKKYFIFNKEEPFKENIKEQRERFSWKKMRENIEALYYGK